MDSVGRDRGALRQVQDHKVEFDKTEMWKRLKKKEPRRKSWILWVFLGGISMIGIIAYCMQKSQQDPTKDTAPSPSITSVEIPADPQSKQNTEVSELSAEVVVSEEPSDNTNIFRHTDQGSSSTKTAEDRNNENSRIEYSANDINPVIAVPFTSKIVKDEVVAANAKSQSSLLTENAISVRASQDELTSLEARDTDNKTSPEQQYASVFVKPLPLLALVVDSDRELMQLSLANLAPLDRRSSTLSPWTFSVLGGVSAMERSLSGMDTMQVAARLATEEALYHMSSGLHLGYKFGSFSFYSGLQFDQSLVRMFLRKSHVVNIQNLDPSVVPLNLVGTQALILQKTSSTYYNRLQRVAMPLGITCQLPFSKRLSIETATNIGLWTRYSGHIVDQFHEVTKIEDSDVKVSPLGYQLSLGYTVPRFGDRIRLSLVYARRPEVSIQQVKESRSTIGVRLSVDLK